MCARSSRQQVLQPRQPLERAAAHLARAEEVEARRRRLALPPRGLLALSEDERALLIERLKARLQLELDEVNAVEAERGSSYLPLTALNRACAAADE